MSLLERPRPPAGSSSTGSPPALPARPSAWVPGLVAGAKAAGLSLLLLVVPLLAGWATAANVTATWTQALRVATAAWLLTQHVAVDYPGGRLSLTPLLLTLVPVLVVYRAGRRLAVDGMPDTATAGPATPRQLAQGLAGLVAAYAGVATLLALMTRSSSAHAVLVQAVLAPAVLALGAGGAGLVRGHPGRRELVAPVVDRLPAPLRRALRPALAGAAVLLVVALVLLAVALVRGGSRMLALHRALDPGAAGSVLLLVGQVGYLPVLVGWAVAWLAGPGFAVGSGSVVSTGAVHLGVLPVVPVLGAVPGRPLPSSLLQALALAGPVLAGVVAGWWAARRTPTSDGAEGGRLLAWRLGDAAVAAALATLLLTLLVALSAGAVGPGRLSDVGPQVLLVGPALLGELVVGALVAAALAHLLSHLRGHGRGHPADPATPVHAADPGTAASPPDGPGSG